MKLDERASLIAALLAGALAFTAISGLDDRSAAVAAADRAGAGRGAILDRSGNPLALTVYRDGIATRDYPLPDTWLTVGYDDPSSKWHGMERIYDRLLDPLSSRTALHTAADRLAGTVAQGDRLRLTIDSRLESVAYQALRQYQGAAVALDPRTGEVLALVSTPACPATALENASGAKACAANPSAPLRNRAIDTLFSPGSTFKTVTLSAALDTGRFHLTDVFSGADAFGPSPYFDNSVYPSNVTRADLTQLTLPQALAFSDNFTFAHIGLTVGASNLLKYAHRYRLGRRIPFDFPVQPSVVADGLSNPPKSVLAQASFGGSVDRVTPLQMALIVSAIGNHGVMMAPHLVRDVESPSGTILQRSRPRTLARVVRPHTAFDETTALKFVVDHGSGFKAQITGVAVAGKTGTAYSGGDKPNAWFICYAPARDPVVAVAVLHQFSGEGFEYAAPIARQIMVAALQEHGYRVR